MKILFLAIILTFSPAVTAADLCPKNFHSFLDRFSTDRTFQEAHTRYPLSYISNTGHTESCDYPDCPFAEDKLSRQKAIKLADPIFPLAERQAEMSLEREIRNIQSQKLVKIYKPDSDSYLVKFMFKPQNSCWQLISVTDHSI